MQDLEYRERQDKWKSAPLSWGTGSCMRLSDPKAREIQCIALCPRRALVEYAPSLFVKERTTNALAEAAQHWLRLSRGAHAPNKYNPRESNAKLKEVTAKMLESIRKVRSWLGNAQNGISNDTGIVVDCWIHISKAIHWTSSQLHPSETVEVPDSKLNHKTSFDQRLENVHVLMLR